MQRAHRSAFGRGIAAAICVVLLASCDSNDEAVVMAKCYADGFVAGRAQQDVLTSGRYFPAAAARWDQGAKMSYALGFSDGGAIRGDPLSSAEVQRYFFRGYEDGFKTGGTQSQRSMMFVPPEGADWPAIAKTSYGRGYHMGHGARSMREWEKQGHRFQSRPATMPWPGDLRERHQP